MISITSLTMQLITLTIILITLIIMLIIMSIAMCDFSVGKEEDLFRALNIATML